MFYPLLVLCSVAYGQCALAEDTMGAPYADKPTCEARLATMLETVQPQFRALYGRGTITARCDTLKALRKKYPNVYTRKGPKGRRLSDPGVQDL